MDLPNELCLVTVTGGILITMLTAQRLRRARAGLGSPPSWHCNVLVCSMPVRANDLKAELKVSEDYAPRAWSSPQIGHLPSDTPL